MQPNSRARQDVQSTRILPLEVSDEDEGVPPGTVQSHIRRLQTLADYQPGVSPFPPGQRTGGSERFGWEKLNTHASFVQPATHDKAIELKICISKTLPNLSRTTSGAITAHHPRRTRFSLPSTPSPKITNIDPGSDASDGTHQSTISLPSQEIPGSMPEQGDRQGRTVRFRSCASELGHKTGSGFNLMTDREAARALFKEYGIPWSAG
jgi:hypothetical protein